MKQVSVKVSFGLMVLIIQSCSGGDFNKSVYDNVQFNQQNSCYKLIGDDQRAECLSRMSTSYGSYKDAIKPKKDN